MLRLLPFADLQPVFEKLELESLGETSISFSRRIRDHTTWHPGRLNLSITKPFGVLRRGLESSVVVVGCGTRGSSELGCVVGGGAMEQSIESRLCEVGPLQRPPSPAGLPPSLNLKKQGRESLGLGLRSEAKLWRSDVLKTP